MRSPSLPNRTGGSPASGFPVGRPRWTGASHLPIASDRALARRFFAAPTRSALWHYVGPREMALARPLALPSCVPSLHGRYSLLGYYERSDPGRTFCRPLPWFPDSRHQNFPPFCLQPSAVLDQTRSTPSTLAALFCSDFDFRSAGLVRIADRIEFTLSAEADFVTDCSFTSSCSPPAGMAPAQLLSVTGPTMSARSGTLTLLFKCALRRTERGLQSAGT